MENFDELPDKVKYAKENSEKIITNYLISKNYEVIGGTRIEDFVGIDLKVTGKDGNIVYIDVKDRELKNQNSDSFLYTTVSHGKSYKNKKTNYVAFVDMPKKTSTFIDFKDLIELIEKEKEIPSKKDSLGYYVLINKKKIKDKGRTVNIEKFI